MICKILSQRIEGGEKKTSRMQPDAVSKLNGLFASALLRDTPTTS